MRMGEILARLGANQSPTGWSFVADDRLTDFATGFHNPGDLRARIYLPPRLTQGAPLVVVLHGCTQTAAGYDAGTGWSRLADQAGFALLLPEQRRSNNANLCFNWFSLNNIARLGGEAESIARMVEAMVGRYEVDQDRVFVTGLSAGGAMAAVMLATYPDVFAGGAIIGGLAYGSAHGVGLALQRMRAPRGDARTLVDAATHASGTTPRRWPTVSLWHGAADATVVPGNMEDLVSQWCGVHGVAHVVPEIETGRNWSRRRWSSHGRMVVEAWLVNGMGHGVPLDPSQGLGTPGPFMLPVGVDSTSIIARSWGIAPRGSDDAPLSPVPAARDARPVSSRASKERIQSPSMVSTTSGVQTVIEDALRAAGLMK